MQIEWDSRMNPHQPHGDWLERPQPPVSYTTSAPTTTVPSASVPTSSSAFAQRRRLSAAHIRPAGPPPNLPIPSLPPPASSAHSSRSDSQDILTQSGSQQMNGRGTRSTSFNRPAPSATLPAVANLSQIRQTSSAPASQSPLQDAAQADDLSDLAPPSILPPSPPRMPERAHENGAGGRRHLSPPSTENNRPSSRRALTRALELAREAVQLDSTNEDPEAAVNAYAQSVALLSEVMERVRRGEDSTESRRSRRRRSVAAQEEEIRRLQNIHDTYADRMNILSIIYSIPPVPYTTASHMPQVPSVSSTSNSSPTNSGFPTTENSPLIPPASYANDLPLSDDAQYNPNGSPFALDDAVLSPEPVPGLPPSFQHPYAAVPYSPPPSQLPQPVPVARGLPSKPRTRGPLPPRQPPPSDSLPHAPTEPLDATYSNSILRTEMKPEAEHLPRHPSGLTPLEEEDDARISVSPPRHDEDLLGMALDTPKNPKRDSHPLPPIPSPTHSSGSSGTPRTSVHVPKAPPSPRSAQVVSKPRRPSTATQRSQPVSAPASQSGPIINPTTTQGTIYQRRTKNSGPSRSASPDSALSAGPIANQKQPQPPLPAVPLPSKPIVRDRSNSQPGHRPSITTTPPLPPSAGPNVLSHRKPSFPSKPVPNPSEISSPQIGIPVPPLLAPPSMSFGIVPFVPTSPLPVAPPSDLLRQPYYMMSLLNASMTSPTGGYITRRLHVPNEVWTFPGAKLPNVAEKIRVIEILVAALEDVQLTSSEYFGAGNVSSGLAMGIGSIGGKEATAWLAKLEEFSTICDGVVANFGKKLGVGEGFILKKTTWSDKLSRRFDKFTNGKNNVDSPIAYMHNLKKLFQSAQLLDEHTKAVQAQPVAQAYAPFPYDVKISAEHKLKRASDFFASVVLTFVIRDLALLLDKYVKKCEKLIEE